MGILLKKYFCNFGNIFAIWLLLCVFWSILLSCFPEFNSVTAVLSLIAYFFYAIWLVMLTKIAQSDSAKRVRFLDVVKIIKNNYLRILKISLIFGFVAAVLLTILGMIEKTTLAFFPSNKYVLMAHDLLEGTFRGIMSLFFCLTISVSILYENQIKNVFKKSIECVRLNGISFFAAGTLANIIPQLIIIVIATIFINSDLVKFVRDDNYKMAANSIPLAMQYFVKFGEWLIETFDISVGTIFAALNMYKMESTIFTTSFCYLFFMNKAFSYKK